MRSISGVPPKSMVGMGRRAARQRVPPGAGRWLRPIYYGPLPEAHAAGPSLVPTLLPFPNWPKPEPSQKLGMLFPQIPIPHKKYPVFESTWGHNAMDIRYDYPERRSMPNL